MLRNKKNLGWQAQTPLREGIAKAYADFLIKTPSDD
jgi:nucleoside-diphosphate-sugar epimerase